MFEPILGAFLLSVIVLSCIVGNFASPFDEKRSHQNHEYRRMNNNRRRLRRRLNVTIENSQRVLRHKTKGTCQPTRSVRKTTQRVFTPATNNFQMTN